jgi:hypothetical protein
MVREIFECCENPAIFSTPVQLSQHPFTSGHCEMVQHFPGKLSHYASHRWKSAWQERTKTFGKPWLRVHGSRCAACQLRKTFHTLRVWGLSNSTSTCFHTTYSNCRHWRSVISRPVSALPTWCVSERQQPIRGYISGCSRTTPHFTWVAESTHVTLSLGNWESTHLLRIGTSSP